MNFVCFSQWSQLPESASELFAESERFSLFCSRIWLETITTHALSEHQTLLVACVVENENVLAILPMMQTSQAGQQSLGSLSNNFTSLYSPLVSQHSQQDVVLSCLAEGLANNLASNRLQISSQSIRFEPIDPNDVNMAKLRHFMEGFGFQSHSYLRFYNWIQLLGNQSFDAYMHERPANLRNTIKRKKRKLKREYDYHIQLFKDADIDKAILSKALEDYAAIYRASWKAKEFFSEFTPALVTRLSKKGWLRLAILYANEQPIAAQIWFVVHAKANIYRLVFDERWKSFSPGSILTEYVMRYAIDTDKVSEIDFLTGNERYKQDWMSVRKERVGIIFSKPSEKTNSFDRAMQCLKRLFLKNNP